MEIGKCDKTIHFLPVTIAISSLNVLGVANVKYYSNPKEMFYDIVPDCNTDNDYPKCEVLKTGDFAKLNVSLVSQCVIPQFAPKRRTSNLIDTFPN